MSNGKGGKYTFTPWGSSFSEHAIRKRIGLICGFPPRKIGYLIRGTKV
jgi:hypothetical protein